MTVGLALGGGGARGNFQVGAVRYLYERNVRPAVIAGTSVGAINAIKLAEGEGDGSDTNRGLRGLIEIWKGLQVSTDMWVEEEWFVNVRNNPLYQWLQQHPSYYQQSVIEQEIALFIFGGPIAAIRTILKLKGAKDELDDLINEIEKVINGHARSLYNLNPILNKLNDPTKLDQAKVKQSGIKLRMSVVALESGSLRYVTENGQLLERDGIRFTASGPPHSAECSPIAAAIQSLKTMKLDLQAQLRHAPTGEKADLIGQIRELDGQITDKIDQLRSCDLTFPPPKQLLGVNLVQGTLASASIPLAFPPIQLGSEYYVDGGVREVVPIDAAIKAGATEVYAILASDSEMDPARDPFSGQLIFSFRPGSANLLDIINRSTNDIMGNEIGLSDLEPYLAGMDPNVNLTVIQPDFDIHDIMTIDPGLIDIRMAQGYMRADDAFQAKQVDPARYRELSEQYSRERNTTLIIRTRYEIWKLEYKAYGFELVFDSNARPGHPSRWIGPDLAATREVRKLKVKLRELVEERRHKGGYVPAECDEWWSTWERHAWTADRWLWVPNGPAAAGHSANSGELMAVDRAIHSPDGKYSLVFQGDGNLVLYRMDRTPGRISSVCRPIDDAIKALNLQISNLQATLKVATPREKPEIIAQINEARRLLEQKNNELQSCNIANPPEIIVSRTPVWDTGTGGPAGACYMQQNGNLTIHDELCIVRWQSHTAGNPGSRLVVKDNGTAAISRPDGTEIWSTQR